MKVDLQRWAPQKWDQIIGNAALKRYMRKLIRKLRKDYETTGQVSPAGRQAIIVTGHSRSGKTMIVKFLVRCLVCLELDDDLNPCQGRCAACRQSPEITGMEGLFSTVATKQGQLPVNFTVIDCTKIVQPSELKAALNDIQAWDHELGVVYLDEVHRLVKRNMDEMLLKEIEDKPVVWIFSTALTKELEQMFLNRCIKWDTELPEVVEMAKWLCDRCDEFGIPWEPEAIKRVMAKSNRIPGLALQALALAAIDPDGLTLDLVNNDWKLQLQ